MPGYVAPMKATVGDLPPPRDRASWSYELKWDGMRVITCTDGSRAQMWSGNRIDVTVRFPELVSVGSAVAGRAAILDGEVVAFSADGRPDFSTMQTRMHIADDREARRRAAQTPVLYVVFDLLHFDGHDLTSLPFEQRVGLLDELLDESDDWRQSTRHDDGEALLDVVNERRLEGVMAKRRDAPYAQGKRSPSWRKIKVRQQGELVVGGWLPGAGARSGRLGALLVGYYDDVPADAVSADAVSADLVSADAGVADARDAGLSARIDGSGALRFAGRVGSGFNDAELETLAELLAPLAIDDDPFTPSLRRADAPGANFVRPEIVVEVAYGEWTPDGRLRHPSYLGRRFDKPAREVGRP